jgi:fructose-1,6-bisphosphatase/inositol monophosphatase family enzyme
LVEIDIEFVKAVAVEAGDRAVKMIADIQPEYKADNSFVTHIDKETEQSIRARLAERYPDFAFQGEEFGRVGEDGIPLWAVDPIDGTTNLVYGIPIWCVSIGLIDEGQAVAGALYMPLTKELYWGVRGKGSYCNGVRLQAKDRDSLHPEDTVGFTSSANKTLDVSPIIGRIRSLGSIAAEVVYTARGALCSHVGCYEGANDLAAALCIAHEAGCISVYLTGEPLDMAQMVRDGKTLAPFIVAPPHMAALIQSLVKPHKAQ